MADGSISCAADFLRVFGTRSVREESHLQRMKKGALVSEQWDRNFNFANSVLAKYDIKHHTAIRAKLITTGKFDLADYSVRDTSDWLEYQGLLKNLTNEREVHQRWVQEYLNCLTQFHEYATDLYDLLDLGDEADENLIFAVLVCLRDRDNACCFTAKMLNDITMKVKALQQPPARWFWWNNFDPTLNDQPYREDKVWRRAEPRDFV